jgi:hypothetical protein
MLSEHEVHLLASARQRHRAKVPNSRTLDSRTFCGPRQWDYARVVVLFDT